MSEWGLLGSVPRLAKGCRKFDVPRLKSWFACAQCCFVLPRRPQHLPSRLFERNIVSEDDGPAESRSPSPPGGQPESPKDALEQLASPPPPRPSSGDGEEGDVSATAKFKNTVSTFQNAGENVWPTVMRPKQCQRPTQRLCRLVGSWQGIGNGSAKQVQPRGLRRLSRRVRSGSAGRKARWRCTCRRRGHRVCTTPGSPRTSRRPRSTTRSRRALALTVTF